MVMTLKQKEALANKLLHTYPNTIVEFDGVVDIEETVDLLSSVVMEFDAKKQKYYFGVVFEHRYECYRWLLDELPDLQEVAYEIING